MAARKFQRPCLLTPYLLAQESIREGTETAPVNSAGGVNERRNSHRRLTHKRQLYSVRRGTYPVMHIPSPFSID